MQTWHDGVVVCAEYQCLMLQVSRPRLVYMDFDSSKMFWRGKHVVKVNDELAI